MSRRLVPIAALGLLIACLAHGSSGSAQDVGLVDDAYHYRYWANGRHDGNYIEWWYFNLFDAQQNLQAVFTYFVADPANLTGHGVAQVVAVAYTPQGIVSNVDAYSPDLFSASYEKADVQIEVNRIEVADAATYRIVGATRDGRLSWDLSYVSEAGAWFAADRMTVGTLAWERMSWLVYMPRAAVRGQLTIDGLAYAVEASGYHDHNWGEWVFPDALWNWAQYSEPGLSFELGDFIGKPVGVASLDVDGQRTIFTKDQYRLVHTRWAFDAVNGKPYPVESLFTAENHATRLTLMLRVTATDVLRGDLPPPLPVPLIYEQTAEYDGRLWRRGQGGDWLPAASFSGGGFKEYTARQWQWNVPPAAAGATVQGGSGAGPPHQRGH